MTFIGNLNEKHCDIYPPHAADFHGAPQSQELIVDVKCGTQEDRNSEIILSNDAADV